MRLRSLVTASLLVLVSVSLANAGVTNVDAVVVPQSAVPGFTANEILIDFDGNLRGQQMILNLTAGSLFHDTDSGGDTPVSSVFWAAVPELRYDSIVAIGGRQSNGARPPATQPILVVGGAVNLEQGAVQKFDATGANMAWAPGTGIDVPSGIDYFTAQLTLSNNAMGTFQYFGSTAAGTGDPWIETFQVVNGVIGGLPPGDTIPPVVTPQIVPFELGVTPLSALQNLQLTATDATSPPVTWAGLTHNGPGKNPAFPNAAAPTIGADGKFTWNPNGWRGGAHTFLFDVSDSATPNVNTANDVLALTVNLTVPEPATLSLFGLALVGFVGFARRRS